MPVTAAEQSVRHSAVARVCLKNAFCKIYVTKSPAKWGM